MSDFTVGNYRRAVRQFEDLYPRDQFDWDQPSSVYTGTEVPETWSTDPRFISWSQGQIEDSVFTLTSLSYVCVTHRSNGNNLGVIVNYLSDTYHNLVLFPEDFDVGKFYDESRIVSSVAISLDLFEIFPYSNSPDELTVVEALERKGLDKSKVAVIASEATSAAYIIDLLSREKVNPEQLRIEKPEAKKLKNSEKQ